MHVQFHRLLPKGRIFFWMLLLGGFLTAAPGSIAQTNRIEGTVRDSSGAPVADARVQIRSGAFVQTHATGSDGAFLFEAVPAAGGKILASAPGFLPAESEWSASAGVAHLALVLAVETLRNRVTVTATRTAARLEDIPGSALVLNSDDVAGTAALTLDDLLRQIPGFALFRRSGSRTANPGSQSASLRGLGSSAASRVLILVDGLPLNDPFAGWIFWGRVPRESIAGIEVQRSGASDLYGSGALAGVIQFRTRTPERPSLLLETSYGNEHAPDFSLWTGTRAGRWDLSLASAAFHTSGYILVPEALRGAVDTAAASEHGTLDLTVARRIGESGRIASRGQYYTESRENGTPLQTNDMALGQGALSGSGSLGSLGAISARVNIQAQTYHQAFSSIAANRMSETLTNRQTIPAQRIGGGLQWTRPAGKFQTLVAGVEAEEVQGVTEEQIYSGGLLSALSNAGGKQRMAGFFAEDIVRLGSAWILTAALRYDHWRNYDAQSVRLPLAPPGPASLSAFAERTEGALNPRLSIVRRLSSNVSLTASAYRGFRAPTLNELYRSFRVGNVLTRGNDALRAERLTGGEAGMMATALRQRLDLRGTFFWNEIVNPVANVTLPVALQTIPNVILRQKQNLGRTRSLGLELDASARINASLEVTGGYQFTAATVRSFPADPSLVGLWVAQVPRQQFMMQGRYAHRSGLAFSLLGRYGGGQFEDDQNTLFMDPYFTLNAQVSRRIGKGFQAFVAAENLLNRRYTVGMTPVATLGPPILARAGLRFSYGER
jgi:outer membrane receptor protein involved in Fe transport